MTGHIQHNQIDQQDIEFGAYAWEEVHHLRMLNIGRRNTNDQTFFVAELLLLIYAIEVYARCEIGSFEDERVDSNFEPLLKLLRKRREDKGENNRCWPHEEFKKVSAARNALYHPSSLINGGKANAQQLIEHMNIVNDFATKWIAPK